MTNKANEKQEKQDQQEINLSVVRHEAMPHYKIIERAEILSVQYDMSAKSQQLLAILTSKIHPERSDLNSIAYHVSREEAERLMLRPDSSRKDFAEVFAQARHELFSTIVQLRFFDPDSQKVHVTESPWISEVRWKEDTDRRIHKDDGFTVTFPPAIHHYLSGIKMAKGVAEGDRYITTDLLVATGLGESKYSQRIYKMIKNKALQVVSQHKKSVDIEFALAQIKETFRLPKSYRPAHIVDKIIRPVISEINKISDLHVEILDVIKSGSRATGVRMRVTENMSYIPALPPRDIVPTNLPASWDDEQSKLYVELTVTLQLPDADSRRWVNDIPAPALKKKLTQVQAAIKKGSVADAKAYYITSLSALHEVLA